MLLLRASDTLGQMDFAQHFLDLLIALETSRCGATLLTENIADFSRWKSLLAARRKTLKLFDPA